MVRAAVGRFSLAIEASARHVTGTTHSASLTCRSLRFPRLVGSMKTPRFVALAFALTLASGSIAQETRLLNLSTRSQVGAGGNVLTVGFTITGTAKKSVLIRGIGPGLAPLGFTGV